MSRALPTNVEPSRNWGELDKPQYIGTGGGRVWHIRRKPNGKGWYAVAVMSESTHKPNEAEAPTLKMLADMIKHRR
jgi:hypothetical protein